ncbi:MAG: mechanosensitive ion channel family protein [Bacilli bacterium]
MKDFEKFLEDYIFIDIIGKIIFIIIVIIAMIIGKKLIKKFIYKKMICNKKIDKSLATLVNIIALFVLFVTGISLILSQFQILKSLMTTLLASSGIAAFAVSFAAQDTLGNMISGVTVIINRPFVVGDTIEIKTENIIGTVDSINFYHTILKTLNNRKLVIPNSTISSSIIENYSDNKEVCYYFDVNIAYDADVDKAIEIIKEEVKTHKDFYKPKSVEDYPKVKVIMLNASSVDLRAWVWSSNPSLAFDMICDLRKSVKEKFDINGIEIPYQYTNVVIRKEENNENN